MILELFPLSTSTTTHNGGDQVEDDRYKGSEETTPRPVDDLHLGVQVTHVDSKDSGKGHLSPTRSTLMSRHESRSESPGATHSQQTGEIPFW